MNPRITRFPPRVDLRMASDPKPPSIWYRILEALAFPLMVWAIAGFFWILDSSTDNPPQPASYLRQSD